MKSWVDGIRPPILASLKSHGSRAAEVGEVVNSEQNPQDSEAEPTRRLSAATVSRLTLYLRSLNALLAEGMERVSSESLAESAGVGSANVRKDLSHLGSFGTRGVGYDVAHLSRCIAQALGLTHEWRVAIVGVGNLGRALARYAGFETRGFDVVALVDADLMVVGTEIGSLRVTDAAELEIVLAKTRTNMVVLALPASVAQSVCDRVINAGINSVLSFAPIALSVPEHVNLRKVDMATELQILAYHAQRLQDPRLGDAVLGDAALGNAALGNAAFGDAALNEERPSA